MNKLEMKEIAKWGKQGGEKKTVQSPAFRNIWAKSERKFVWGNNLIFLTL
jgi:hypothetical protein